MDAQQTSTTWLERVENLFLRLGIKSQTMDDVARELGISKKTLYQLVENKDDLVHRVLENHIAREKIQCLDMAAHAENAIDQMVFVMDSNSQEFAQMKANVLYDLQKYHRDAWIMIRKFHHDFIYKLVAANLERGKKEGLYRTDFNIDIITRIHLATVFSLFDEELFPSSTIRRDVLFREYMKYYLHGIVTEKGHRLLQSKLK
ncbi:MAG TPA: TetR/AcrR family transcriptional regulator [Saprospiraceae bacterium]|nr:TetR/AcrR family transcriptional regulator [Saprospiraceae bacterium]